MNALVVDDSIFMRSFIKSILVKEGYTIVGEAQNGEQAIDLAIELEPDLITLDNILPDMKGLDILLTIRDERLSSKVVMVSAVGQKQVQVEAKFRGALEYVVKPFDHMQLMTAINKVLPSMAFEKKLNR